MSYNDRDKDAKTYFGGVLKNAMAVKNLSQKDLSELIGVPFWRVSDMTRGLAMPTDKQFNEMCSLLNMSEGSFFPNGKIKLPSDKDYQANRQKRLDWVNKKKLGEKAIGKAREEEKGINYDVEDEVAVDKSTPVIQSVANITPKPVQMLELGEVQFAEVKPTQEPTPIYQNVRDYESELKRKDKQITAMDLEIDELKVNIDKSTMEIKSLHDQLANMRGQLELSKYQPLPPISEQDIPTLQSGQKVKSVSIDVPVGDKMMKIMVTVE
jgi:transcriptional regulator with XRE-family HTH domain